MKREKKLIKSKEVIQAGILGLKKRGVESRDPLAVAIMPMLEAAASTLLTRFQMPCTFLSYLTLNSWGKPFSPFCRWHRAQRCQMASPRSHLWTEFPVGLHSNCALLLTWPSFTTGLAQFLGIAWNIFPPHISLTWRDKSSHKDYFHGGIITCPHMLLPLTVSRACGLDLVIHFKWTEYDGRGCTGVLR